MYATQSDMENRFGAEEIIQLTDRGNTGSVNLTVLNQALSDAQAVIDGYLRSAYSLPLSIVPAELVRVCCDFARFFLYDDRVTEAVQKRRDEALNWLRDVASGRTTLGLDTSGNIVQEAAGGVKYSANPRQFNAATLSGY